MASKSVCRRLAIQLSEHIEYGDTGVAFYVPKNKPMLSAETLRGIADMLDALTEKRRKE